MAEEPLLFAFHDGLLFVFERATVHSASFFGGPLCVEISGIPHGPKPLHQIASLGSLHIPALSQHFLRRVPLIYGLGYSGCELSYRVEGSGKIILNKITPAQSMGDWPYSNYPPLLPYMPLRLADTPDRVSYDDFASRFPNYPDAQPGDLMVAVPPPATLGMSLWGEAGDGEGTTIVFACDLAAKTIDATNVTG